jgi:hypothetical protein
MVVDSPPMEDAPGRGITDLLVMPAAKEILKLDESCTSNQNWNLLLDLVRQIGGDVGMEPLECLIAIQHTGLIFRAGQKCTNRLRAPKSYVAIRSGRSTWLPRAFRISSFRFEVQNSSDFKISLD